jgi:hypothetical protein
MTHFSTSYHVTGLGLGLPSVFSSLTDAQDYVHRKTEEYYKVTGLDPEPTRWVQISDREWGDQDGIRVTKVSDPEELREWKRKHVGGGQS